MAHLMLVPLSTSHFSGMFFCRVLTKFRSGVPPYIVQSPLDFFVSSPWADGVERGGVTTRATARRTPATATADQRVRAALARMSGVPSMVPPLRAACGLASLAKPQAAAGGYFL